MTQAINITPQMLADGNKNCTTTAANIDGQLAGLRAYVSDLATLWLGVSSQQYVSLMTDYDTYGRMLHDALTGIADGLQGNFHNYTTTEATNESTLLTVNGSIPGANLG
jgi:WXG100 family type VII secretion target